MMKPRILVVHRRSAYTDIVSDDGNPEIKKMIYEKHPLVDGLVTAHEVHTASMKLVKRALVERKIPHTWRHHIHDVDTSEFDMVVTVGGDGTVLHASHSIDKTPILAVNSAPGNSVGFFTCTDAYGFGSTLDRIINKELKPSCLSRMEVRVNKKVVTDRALNDVLFCHDCPASTTRYILSYENIFENQMSSGVWIATAAGSTAAIRAAGGKKMSPTSRRLQFRVREPYPSGGLSFQTIPTAVRGFISSKQILTIYSKTESAKLYVDGPHVAFSVSFGDEVTLSNANRPIYLYMIGKK